MSRRIILRPPVDDDLHSIVQYLEESAGNATADRFLESAFAAFDDLAQMPGKGSPKRFRKRSGAPLRSWGVPGFACYLIYYVGGDDAIIVVAVLHGARNVRAILRKRDLPG